MYARHTYYKIVIAMIITLVCSYLWPCFDLFLTKVSTLVTILGVVVLVINYGPADKLNDKELVKELNLMILPNRIKSWLKAR